MGFLWWVGVILAIQIFHVKKALIEPLWIVQASGKFQTAVGISRYENTHRNRCFPVNELFFLMFFSQNKHNVKTFSHFNKHKKFVFSVLISVESIFLWKIESSLHIYKQVDDVPGKILLFQTFCCIHSKISHGSKKNLEYYVRFFIFIYNLQLTVYTSAVLKAPMGHNLL